MTDQPLSEIAGTPRFQTIDGVSIRFVESDRRAADALLLTPWPERVFAYVLSLRCQKRSVVPSHS